MTAPTYNPEIIERFAAKLYERGDRLVWLWGSLGMLAGLLIGTFGTAAIPGMTPGFRITGIIMSVSVGLFVGRAIGTDRAFSLWLQAQTALCQVAIEKNTRPIPE